MEEKRERKKRRKRRKKKRERKKHVSFNPSLTSNFLFF